MATDSLRPRALACLRESRVTVLGVRLDASWRPVGVVARVQSSREQQQPYRVRYLTGNWTCTCSAGEQGEACAHVAAVALVTTHKEVAA